MAGSRTGPRAGTAQRTFSRFATARSHGSVSTPTWTNRWPELFLARVLPAPSGSRLRDVHLGPRRRVDVEGEQGCRRHAGRVAEPVREVFHPGVVTDEHHRLHGIG